MDKHKVGKVTALTYSARNATRRKRRLQVNIAKGIVSSTNRKLVSNTSPSHISHLDSCSIAFSTKCNSVRHLNDDGCTVDSTLLSNCDDSDSSNSNVTNFSTSSLDTHLNIVLSDDSSDDMYNIMCFTSAENSIDKFSIGNITTTENTNPFFSLHYLASSQSIKENSDSISYSIEQMQPVVTCNTSDLEFSDENSSQGRKEIVDLEQHAHSLISSQSDTAHTSVSDALEKDTSDTVLLIMMYWKRTIMKEQ